MGFNILSYDKRWQGVYQIIPEVKTGEQYTLSLYMKAESPFDVVFCVNSVPSNDYAHVDSTPSVQLSTEWKHYSHTFTVTTDGKGKFKVESSLETTPKYYICGCKLERGANQYPVWTPNSDELILTKSELKMYLDNYMATKVQS